ncbi:hypothetical protein [Streptomyces sp. Isolate_219]|uniref:hypothetical protein n=1 Tax=Streptomyces sp. Isolate_219 TaxID=2950110 RepID=UPI0021C67CCD|nr:hypothetical protein [Streptomyces sp. Isolate_219]MCR8574724.1 hypothetical protein [Streptomyces sp. Isolate_219]
MTSTDGQFTEDTDTIMLALAHGVTGDTDTGLTLLEPIAQRGPVQAAGICAALAETMSAEARAKQTPGHFFGFLVATTDGQPADANDLPPGVRFAAQFSTAWANGERDTAYSLFDALIDGQTDEQMQTLGDSISALFEMASASLREVVDRKRAEKGGR